jgi:hypothetical protein
VRAVLGNTFVTLPHAITSGSPGSTTRSRSCVCVAITSMYVYNILCIYLQYVIIYVYIHCINERVYSTSTNVGIICISYNIICDLYHSSNGAKLSVKSMGTWYTRMCQVYLSTPQMGGNCLHALGAGRECWAALEPPVQSDLLECPVSGSYLYMYIL